jgi:hypothetical protein
LRRWEDPEVLAERVDRQRRADQLGQTQGQELEVPEVLHPLQPRHDCDFGPRSKTLTAIFDEG